MTPIPGSSFEKFPKISSNFSPFPAVALEFSFLRYALSFQSFVAVVTILGYFVFVCLCFSGKTEDIIVT